MQLILETERSTIGIKDKMSTLEQGSLGEKLMTNGNTIEAPGGDVPNSNKENILSKENIIDNCKESASCNNDKETVAQEISAQRTAIGDSAAVSNNPTTENSISNIVSIVEENKQKNHITSNGKYIEESQSSVVPETEVNTAHQEPVLIKTEKDFTNATEKIDINEAKVNDIDIKKEQDDSLEEETQPMAKEVERNNSDQEVDIKMEIKEIAEIEQKVYNIVRENISGAYNKAKENTSQNDKESISDTLGNLKKESDSVDNVSEPKVISVNTEILKNNFSPIAEKESDSVENISEVNFENTESPEVNKNADENSSLTIAEKDSDSGEMINEPQVKSVNTEPLDIIKNVDENRSLTCDQTEMPGIKSIQDTQLKNTVEAPSEITKSLLDCSDQTKTAAFESHQDTRSNNDAVVKVPIKLNTDFQIPMECDEPEIVTSKGDEKADTLIDCEKADMSMDCDTAEASINGDKAETSINCDRAETSINGNKAETSMDCDMAKTSIRCDKAETSIDCDKAETSITRDKTEISIDCDKADISINYDNADTPISWDKAETSIDCDNADTSISWDKAETSIDCVKAETSINCNKAKTSINGKNAETSMDCDKSETSISCDKAETSIDCDKAEPAINYDKSQTSMDCEKAVTSINCDKVETSIDYNKEGTSISCDKADISMNYDKTETSINSDKADVSMNCDKAVTSINCDKVETSIAYDKADTSISCDKADTPINYDKAVTSINSDKADTSMDCDKAETSMDCNKAETSIDCDKAQTSMECNKTMDGATSDVVISAQQSAKCIEMSNTAAKVEGIAKVVNCDNQTDINISESVDVNDRVSEEDTVCKISNEAECSSESNNVIPDVTNTNMAGKATCPNEMDVLDTPVTYSDVNDRVSEEDTVCKISNEAECSSESNNVIPDVTNTNMAGKATCPNEMDVLDTPVTDSDVKDRVSEEDTVCKISNEAECSSESNNVIPDVTNTNMTGKATCPNKMDVLDTPVTDSVNEILDVDEIKVICNKKEEPVKKPKVTAQQETAVEKNRKSTICRLSNTLNILSDDEDEPTLENVCPNNITESSDKQCINIEDDDDIMLIDEDTPSKEDEARTAIAVGEGKADNIPISENSTIKSNDAKESEISRDFVTINEKELKIPEYDIPETITKPEINEKMSETIDDNLQKPKPLLAESLFKSYKKNFADMTRDDLEEFCVLKIVESVIDRSNLTEIRSKIKNMAQNIEQYKKKADILTKQNRDLQVVLKSVQEEQKKAGDSPIMPLKITRSVGMQVLMTDKNARKKVIGPGTNASANNNANTRQTRNTAHQSPRQQSQQNNSQTIPVPRLVPATATNNAIINKSNTGPQVNSPKKSVKNSNPQNGMRISQTAPKAEKRSHNKMLTVDLTDDEPPAKIAAKATPTPPVRLVNPQNLMAPRQPIPQPTNHPRKVYIPIGGPQGQSVRPGQTIMLKSVAPPGPRQRAPMAPMVRIPQSAVRMARAPGGRHPAPLPEPMKQYQPPNWKALPPAPDLKLAKVENGIVISWKIDGYEEDSYEEIASFQLYAYQETSSPPNTNLWKKIGDVKALPLPMACTLTQFMAGYKYYFAVRAVDVKSRLGPFSLPGSILLLNKM